VVRGIDPALPRITPSVIRPGPSMNEQTQAASPFIGTVQAAAQSASWLRTFPFESDMTGQIRRWTVKFQIHSNLLILVPDDGVDIFLQLRYLVYNNVPENFQVYAEVSVDQGIT
jgi:hypothetical protein